MTKKGGDGSLGRVYRGHEEKGKKGEG